jgi:membrane protease YdiL (CAAX protease family)
MSTLARPLPKATPLPRSQPSPRLWLALGAPPLLFLLAIMAASVSFGLAAGPSAAADPAAGAAIATAVSGATPYLLLVVQLLMLGVWVGSMRADGLSLRAIGWRLAPGQSPWREAALGAAVGAGLALAYFTVLSPLMVAAQTALGDYVPAGELFPALGSALGPFFLANVVLAPFVEESLYRGYALTGLAQRFRLPAAIALSCLFFGLLHWTGGLWYVLLTGLVAGGVFAGLVAWRGNVVAAFATHLVLNLIEFGVVWGMTA